MPREELNMHKINDYLITNRDLSHAELRVVLYTIHQDYGRRKNGRFWRSAQGLADEIGCERKTVFAAWEKMVRKGWLKDTGERMGRATIWQIQYANLWNDFVDRPANGSSVVQPVDDSIDLIAQSVPSIVQPVDADSPSTGRPIAQSVGANPPNQSSELNPPKEEVTAVSIETGSHSLLRDEGGSEGKSPVQGKTQSLSVQVPPSSRQTRPYFVVQQDKLRAEREARLARVEEWKRKNNFRSAWVEE